MEDLAQYIFIRLCSFSMQCADVVEPSFFAKAHLDPTWVDAMNKDFQALEENHTWDMAYLSTGVKKYDTNGFTKWNFA